MYVQGQCVGAASSCLHTFVYTVAINDKNEGVHDPLWYISTSFKKYKNENTKIKLWDENGLITSATTWDFLSFLLTC